MPPLLLVNRLLSLVSSTPEVVPRALEPLTPTLILPLLLACALASRRMPATPLVRLLPVVPRLSTPLLVKSPPFCTVTAVALLLAAPTPVPSIRLRKPPLMTPLLLLVAVAPSSASAVPRLASFPSMVALAPLATRTAPSLAPTTSSVLPAAIVTCEPAPSALITTRLPIGCVTSSGAVALTL